MLALALLVGCSTSEEPVNPFDEEAEVSRQQRGSILLQLRLEGRFEEQWLPAAPWQTPPSPGGESGQAQRRNRADGVVVREVRGIDLHGGEQRIAPLRTVPEQTGPDGRIAIIDLPPGVYTITLQRAHYEDTAVEGVEVGFGSKTVVEPVTLRRQTVRVEGSFLLAAPDGSPLPDASGEIKVVLASRWGLCGMRPISREQDERAGQDRPGEDFCPEPCLVEASRTTLQCMARGQPGEWLLPLCGLPTTAEEVERFRTCRRFSPGGIGWTPQSRLALRA
ncbi:MAG: carboxypeptidase regulatory-like domain-containing protein [Deltaproteobacteria bacterium]|nr:carboxypeptidase regulatory-like domain-containing protein [Deltaproteobacteria bacterium]